MYSNPDALRQHTLAIKERNSLMMPDLAKEAMKLDAPTAKRNGLLPRKSVSVGNSFSLGFRNLN